MNRLVRKPNHTVPSSCMCLAHFLSLESEFAHSVLLLSFQTTLSVESVPSSCLPVMLLQEQNIPSRMIRKCWNLLGCSQCSLLNLMLLGHLKILHLIPWIFYSSFLSASLSLLLLFLQAERNWGKYTSLWNVYRFCGGLSGTIMKCFEVKLSDCLVRRDQTWRCVFASN